MKPFNTIVAGFAWIGVKIKNKIISLKTKQGWFMIAASYAAKRACLELTNVVSHVIIYCNGGKMHMEKRKARCGAMVELDKYQLHLDTCQECLKRKKFLDDTRRQLEGLIKEDEVVEACLTEAEIYDRSMKILKLMLLKPEIAKKLQKIYNENKKYIDPILNEEEEQSKLKEVGNKLGFLKTISNKVSDKAKKTKVKLKIRIKSFLSKLKQKFLEARKRTRAIVYFFLTTVLPSLIAELIFNINLMSFVLTNIPYVDKITGKLGI